MELQDIYTSFANTEYGKHLQDSIRWEKYNLGNLTNQEWCRLLGEDANNLEHMQVTYELARQFIEHQNNSNLPSISPASADLILLSAIIHDQAEAITSDVSFGDKSSSDELKEITVFERHLDAMNPHMDKVTKTMAQTAIRSVIFASSNPEAKAFNAIERTGYLMTALRAAQIAPLLDEGKVKTGLSWLTADVLLNQIPELTKLTREYSLPNEILSCNASFISQLFEDIPSDTFDHYTNNRQQKWSDFEKAQQAWSAFCLEHEL